MKKNNILIIITIVVLVFIFIIYNFASIKDKNKNNKDDTTKITTTKSLSSDKIFKDKIMIEGQEEEVDVKEYKTYFGYKFNYMVDYFKVTASSNNTYLVTSIYNEDMYIKIELIDESDYYREYEKLKDDDKYTFLKNKNVFLKVTKVIANTSEYISGLGVRMDYTINSIEI